MGYGAIIGALISAGTAAYSQSQASDASSAVQNQPKPGKYDPYRIKYIDRIDPRAAQLQAVDSNYDRLPYINDLVNAGNAYNYSQALRYYRKIQPYFDQLQNQIGANALSYAKGELPQDVQAQIARSAAERGIAGGYGYGSQGFAGGAGANLNLRNLGLASLDLSKFGSQLGMQVNQNAKSLLPNLLGVQDFFLTPKDALGAQEFNSNWENKRLFQNADYINTARAANVGALNAFNTRLADQSYASGLQQAQATQQMGQQLGGLLMQYGMNNSGGSGGGMFGGSGGGLPADATSSTVGAQGVYSGGLNMNQPLA